VFQTSVSVLESKSAIIYPNPTDSKIHIETKNMIQSIELVAADGKHYLFEILPGTALDIELGELKSGIYTLILRFTNDEVVHQRISIIR
jgi:hypothetical protein